MRYRVPPLSTIIRFGSRFKSRCRCAALITGRAAERTGETARDNETKRVRVVLRALRSSTGYDRSARLTCHAAAYVNDRFYARYPRGIDTVPRERRPFPLAQVGPLDLRRSIRRGNS